jgi:glycerol kinase
MDKKYILAIDSGSTGIRAILFNKQGEIVGREYEKTPAEHPEPGAIEHEPEMMWQTLLTVVNHVFNSSHISPNEVAAVGISNQRASFSIWDKKTGKSLIKFINWADVRAANTVDAMNNNPKWKMLKKIANVLSNFSPNGLMTVTKMLNFTTAHAVCRLKWILDEKPELKAKCIAGEAMFGTLDTWYIYRLTGGKVHITDSTNAVSTGLYNPFQLQWNDTVCKLFGIPMSIFPKVIENNGEFGIIDASLFDGSVLPIRGAMGDQQAALFGHCCFNKGEGKI